jgi:dihydropteroate synthase
MAIMNLSPSSFFKRSVKQSEDEIQFHIERTIEEGADIIDVGAISSAPRFLYNGKDHVSETTEMNRLSHFFKAYKKLGTEFPVSVDTQSAKTADYVLSQGATTINDISGFKHDPKLPGIVSEHSASAIVMACRKVPGDVFSMEEILTELQKSINLGLDTGIDKSKIVVDPGLGSWVPHRKTENDYKLISQLSNLRKLKHCILVGISRKSFIGEILNVPPEKRLWGSLAATTVAILEGAHIIRTHDVRATKDVSQITDYVKKFRKKDTAATL